MAASLVDADDEPALLSVARLAAELESSEALLSEAASQLEKGDVPPLLKRLAASTLLTGAPEKDAEAAFLVLSHAAGKLPAEPALAAASQVLDRVADAAADAPALRLRILFGLFNAVPHARARHAVLLRTLQFATATGQAEAVTHLVHRVDAWAADWAVGPADLRALRLAVYNLLNKSKPAGKEAFAALVAYLALFEGEAAPVLADVRDAAASAATHFIAASDVFQCDLLDMAAVRQLEGDAKYKQVHRLLTIFLTGRLQDYMAFQKEAQDVLTAHKLSHDDCVAKMRLMSLAALGAESASGSVPYSLIRDTLQVPAEEVERWVVKAIGAKVLEAKMDQVREVVLITRCLHRVFGKQQWADLRDKLRAWRENVAGVASTVATTRSTGELPAAVKA